MRSRLILFIVVPFSSIFSVLIGRKSKQPERKITVMRRTVDDEEPGLPLLSSVMSTDDVSPPPPRLDQIASSNISEPKTELIAPAMASVDDDGDRPSPPSDTTGSEDALPPVGMLHDSSSNISGRIDIIAPAGKLGMMVETTPGGGTP